MWKGLETPWLQSLPKLHTKNRPLECELCKKTYMMCFGLYRHQDECRRSGQEENTPAVAPSSAQGSPFQSSRAESRRAVVSAQMEESKPCALQCLPREVSHRWREGRLLGARPHPLIHQERLAELLWPKPFHICHMEGPRVHQSPYYVQGSCPCIHLPPTREESPER